ncbi:MAG: VCBS repeat-containing protein [Saprospiraceae bacterium]|nr:VCBS repeat-containing protein [Saprospiraceae bacterium]
MQDRIYLNNANQFTLSTRALPVNGMNTSVCLPFDYDMDGDMDLFVGSRSFPQQYGAAPDNYLYENNGKGSFQNVAKTVCPDLAKAGFVTSATLVDLDGDKKSELVVACAWGEIQAFSFKGKKVNKLPSFLPAGYSGMWSYVSHADLDNDGDEDLVCGNMGLNSGLSHYPLTLWVGDFDANKTVDKIISRKINDRNCPVMMKREFMEQLPSLKKNSLKHEEYAHKTIEDLLPADTRSKAQTWKADYFGSVVVINKGKMQFEVRPLPKKFQTSYMSSAVLLDVNKDGFTDIVPIGNRSEFAPQFGRLDGYCGDVIINDKGASFAHLSASDAGLDLRGDARAAYLIKGKKTPTFMVSFNNSQAKLYAQR